MATLNVVTLAAASTPAVSGANPVAVAGFVNIALDHAGIGPVAVTGEAVTTDANGVLTYTGNIASYGKTGTFSFSRSAALDLEPGTDLKANYQWTVVVTYDGATLMTQTQISNV